MKLGEILIERGLVSRADVETALERQKTEGERLGSILVAMGVLTVSQLFDALRYQKQIEAALEICKRTWIRWENSHGAGHPSTQRARYNFARALLVAGRAADAFPHAEAAYIAHRDLLGRQHYWTLESGALLTELHRTVPDLAANFATAC